MENKYFSRIAALRAIMEKKGWDAVIVTGSDPHNSEYPAKRWKQVEWLSGFAGEAGDMVITADHAGLWTDSRYFIYADKVLKNTGIQLHKTKISGEIPASKWLAEYAFPDEDKRIVIAVDGLCIARSAIDEIEKAMLSEGRHRGIDDGGYTIVNVPDFMDMLWEDRPAVPHKPIITVSDDIVGESRQDKILWLRKFLIDNNCTSILLTSLDEIVWLLNVRGSDVEYNPVVISYLIVSLDGVYWYVRKTPLHVSDDETVSSFGELKSEGVEILPYDDIDIGIGEFLAGSSSDRIYIDRGKVNFNINSLLEDSENVYYGPSPISLRKAVKNDVEIEGMREAHIKDGLAMEKFLYWLECRMETGSIVNERDAADMLGHIRSSIEGYRGDSFETISAYGSNAALPHYITPVSGGAVLENHGLYLCDSGGQFISGTTDITRTIPLGHCTPMEKEDYTKVLKGHIDLAMAVFPVGTAGCHIDVLARNPLWSSKCNFGHGTGHGVGFFLNVHEGPQDIRQNFNNQPLLPGMITSDEPGIYREGQYGIRHESLLLCKDAGANDFGSWLEFEVLTLCHIDTSIIVKELLTYDEIAWLNAYNKRVYDTLSPYLPENISVWLKEKTIGLAIV